MPSRSISPTNDPDDWSSITESSQRRKVQNRISQRNHRQRVRARIAQLEAAVASSGLVVPVVEQQSSRLGKTSHRSSRAHNVASRSETFSAQASECSPSPFMPNGCHPQWNSHSFADVQSEVKLESGRASPVLQSTQVQRTTSQSGSSRDACQMTNSKGLSGTSWFRPQTAEELAKRFPTIHAMVLPQSTPELAADDCVFDNGSSTPLSMSSDFSGDYTFADLNSWTGDSLWNVQQTELFDRDGSYAAHGINQWLHSSAVSTTEYEDAYSTMRPYVSHQHSMQSGIATGDPFCSQCICKPQQQELSRSPTPASMSLKPECAECMTFQRQNELYSSALVSRQ